MKDKPVILIIDDVPENLQVLGDMLERDGYEVMVASNGQQAFDVIKSHQPDLILLDIMMPGMNGFEVCRHLKDDQDTCKIPVIFISALGLADHKLQAFSEGAVDYITKPFQTEEVIARVRTHIKLAQMDALKIEITERKRAEEELRKAYDQIRLLQEQLQAENECLMDEVRQTHNNNEIIGQSPVILNLFKLIDQVATTDSSVLIHGETGTGKELVARAIHSLSRRKDRALVKVDCASLPSTLIEGELFGRERGAYTGALTMQKGRFEIADNSTIFLDEIGELSLELQTKLLRVLQDGEFERLGSSKTIKVDVRVIAATNRNLAEMVKSGKFREDLYYRLNVFPVETPPLRTRQEDIPLLVWAFVRKLSDKMGRKIKLIPKNSMDALQLYGWPGNVRELQNIVEQSLIKTTGETLIITLPGDAGLATACLMTLEQVERDHIVKVLKITRGRVKGPNGAATLLDLNASTLYAKMQKLEIQPASHKDHIST
jgi:DNA-binding NtrC family response regulator